MVMSEPRQRTLQSRFVNGHLRRDIRATIPLPRSRTFANPIDFQRDINVLISNVRGMHITQTADRRMQVDVSAVTKSASAIVAMFCVTSLIFGSISRFQMIHPFVAAVIIMASGCFYVMGKKLEQAHKK
jgi:hypothetical protein